MGAETQPEWMNSLVTATEGPANIEPSSELEGQWRGGGGGGYHKVELNSKGNGEGPDKKFATLNPSSELEGQRRGEEGGGRWGRE